MGNKDPFDYILPFHVMLCSYNDNYVPYPEGSGTFIALTSPSNKKIYAILTAEHVLEKIAISKNDEICIAKPINREGNTCAAKTHFTQIITFSDKKYFRTQTQNHKNSYNQNEIDLAIIILDINKQPSNTNLYDNSVFFDLDDNEKQKEKYKIPVFYKGACKNSEVKNNTLNTEIIIGKNLETKINPKTKLKYHEFSIPNNESIKGASDSGLWSFSNDNGLIIINLHGTVIEEKFKPNKHIIIAIDLNYQNFLKKKIIDSLHTQLKPIIKPKNNFYITDIMKQFK